MAISTVNRSWSFGLLVYLGLLIAGIALVLGVLQIGQQFGEATSVSQLAKPASTHVDILFHVLVSLVAVILLGVGLSKVCQFIGQPPVIGEILAGIALGPSLLGMISPDAMQLLIPDRTVDPTAAVSTTLKVVAQIGVILYMFLVGLELNVEQLRRKAHAAVAISHSSIVLPFCLGSMLALWLYPLLSERSVPFVSFALFLGVAMSVTAFPVLARILTDRGLNNTAVGSVALSCAAADDVTAWCLLSLVVGVAKAEVSGAARVFGGSIVFVAMIVLVVRPLLVRFTRRMEHSHQSIPTYATASIYVLVLSAAATTEWIGIHAIFGAFLMGMVIPADSRLATNFLLKLKEPVTVLMLPAFFAYTGMRTEIGLLNDLSQWGVCLVIIAVATLGKFGGTLVAARMAGESWRDASILGTLMNTRGLMELIVLNIGLDLGIISPTLFAMMVIMALATTMITAPVLKWLMPDGSLSQASHH